MIEEKTLNIKVHDKATYGEYAVQLDELYRTWTDADKVACDFYYDENNPVASAALERMTAAYAEYEQIKAQALDEMQREVDETHDALIAQTRGI